MQIATAGKPAAIERSPTRRSNLSRLFFSAGSRLGMVEWCFGSLAGVLMTIKERSAADRISVTDRIKTLRKRRITLVSSQVGKEGMSPLFV
jgi:hypothetical protein